MRSYENISKLIDKLERNFEIQGLVHWINLLPIVELTYEFSFFWVSGGVIMSQQKGVFRVNCIDCLDRTNVVQVGDLLYSSSTLGVDLITPKSAFARFVLQSQLEAVAVENAYETGDRSEADIIFNDGECAGKRIIPTCLYPMQFGPIMAMPLVVHSE